jgi:hypothetical protein
MNSNEFEKFSNEDYEAYLTQLEGLNEKGKNELRYQRAIFLRYREKLNKNLSENEPGGIIEYAAHHLMFRQCLISEVLAWVFLGCPISIKNLSDLWDGITSSFSPETRNQWYDNHMKLLEEFSKMDIPDHQCQKLFDTLHPEQICESNFAFLTNDKGELLPEYQKKVA